jgi:hypothetical protein
MQLTAEGAEVRRGNAGLKCILTAEVAEEHKGNTIKEYMTINSLRFKNGL